METTVNQSSKSRSKQAIAAALVTDTNLRLHWLSRAAGNHGGRLQCTVAEMLAKLDEDHSGEWDFFALSNGGFYMAPASDRAFRLTSVHGFAAEVGANAAGIVACVMAYSDLQMLEDGHCFAEAHQLLTAYIGQLPSAFAGLILAVLE